MSLEDSILRNFGGPVINNLNHILGNLDDLSADTEFPSHVTYIDTLSLEFKLPSAKEHFTVFSLNIQSINAKFDYLSALFKDLSAKGVGFSAICLQESWLSKEDDVNFFQIPNYNIIHQGKTCSGHGGLIIYLHENYSWQVRQLHEQSDTWEGLFIDIYGDNLAKHITLGNIYRPPKCNNNDQVISTFINELAPVITKLGKECSETIIVGDFNIDLLKVGERQKYAEYLDLFQTNSFYPKLILPTRFSSKSCTLIDQIFCKTTNATRSASANMIISDISDHLPYYISIKKLKSNQSNMKYIKVRQNSIKAMQGFCDALDKANIINAFNSDLTLDPNVNYNILENMLTKLYEQHFSLKTVRYDKYKHKKENLITTGILHSIKYRDKLYSKLKQTAPTDADFSILSVNLSVYKKILNKTIRSAKRSYYASLFEKSKTSAKDTWAAIKMIMNSNSNQTKFPKYFQINDMHVVDKKVIANQFNEFFVNIGSKLAQTIPNVDT